MENFRIIKKLNTIVNIFKKCHPIGNKHMLSMLSTVLEHICDNITVSGYTQSYYYNT